MLAVNPFLYKKHRNDSAVDTFKDETIVSSQETVEPSFDGELDFNAVAYFCGSVFLAYLDEMSDNDKIVYEMLVHGLSVNRIAKNLNISEKSVSQIFFNVTNKIKEAYLRDCFSMNELKKEVEEQKVHIENLKRECKELRFKIYQLQHEQIQINRTETEEPSDENGPILCENARRLLKTPSRFLPLSTRVINVLKDARVKTFEDIPQLNARDLEMLRQCGPKTIFELRNFLSHFSLSLGMSRNAILATMAKLSDEDIRILWSDIPQRGAS